MKKIREIDYLFLTNSLSGGGAERAINIAVNEIAKKGIKVGLIAINAGPQDLFAPKVPTYEINRAWQGGPISLLMAYIRTYFLICRIGPQRIVLNCDLPEFLGAFIFGPWKITVVEHVPKPWSDRLTLGRLIRRVLNARKVEWVKVSDHLQPWLSGTNVATHIPNAIYENESVQTSSHRTGDNIERLVFIGRLTKAQKQPHWMLDIAELSKKELVFFGDGLYRKDLELEALRKGLHVDFQGFVSNPWDLVKPNDLLVIPSAWEGDGLVVVEALSRNIPIILNRVNDLTRFELPDKHYCSGVTEFVERINQYEKDLPSLIAGSEFSEKLMLSRNPELVASKWIEYLTKVK
jgi:glycosyltransferase involved in cell wall biosynthesis